MRWRTEKFALFAVIALAASAAVVIPTAQAAEPTVDTEVGLFWRDQVEKQPEGDGIRFFVAVIAKSGTARPLGTVSVKVDGSDSGRKDLLLKEVASSDSLAKTNCGDDPCSISDDFRLNLGFSPHFFQTTYSGDTDTFKPSSEELGFARGILSDSPRERSNAGEPVTYTFQLLISSATPQNRRPKSPVDYFDSQGRTAAQRGFDAELRATPWTVVQDPGLVTTSANYPAGGEDVFLPVQASVQHSVVGPDPTPGGTTAPPAPGRTTSTTRRVLGRTPTTAALAPINPSPVTTLPGETPSTTESFGDFVTSSTPTTRSLSAVGANNDEGPPIAVVATTLLALGALGGVAAYRRYRRGGVDWF